MIIPYQSVSLYLLHIYFLLGKKKECAQRKVIDEFVARLHNHNHIATLKVTPLHHEMSKCPTCLNQTIVFCKKNSKIHFHGRYLKLDIKTQQMCIVGCLKCT